MEVCQADIPRNLLLQNQQVLLRYSQSRCKSNSQPVGDSFGDLLSHDNRADFSNFSQNDESTNHICLQEANVLRKVDLVDLQVGRINRGCFISLTVVDTCYFTGTCLCILVIDSPGQLIELQLYNYFPLSVFSKSRGDFWFPIGTNIHLKEPYCLPHALNVHPDHGGLRVDNMLNMRICRPYNISTVSALKAQGNVAFKAEQFHDARMLYSLALNSMEADVGLQESLLCNRAAASFHIGCCQDAVVDCNAALDLNPDNFKAAYRKALALMRLHNYNESRVLLQRLLALEKNSASTMSEISNKISVIGVAISQRSGLYDFMTLPFHPRQQADTGSFLGPLEIRAAGTTGRGLYLTRDVRKGELLLVEHPVAFNSKSSSESVLMDGMHKNKSRDQDHYATLVDVVHLTCRDRQMNALLSVLSSQKESIDFLPAIEDLYWHKIQEDVSPLSAHTINGICLINCFCMEITASPSVPAREAATRCVEMMKSKVIGMGSGRREIHFLPPNAVMEKILDPGASASDITQVLQASSSTRDINAADPSGFTALHCACIMQNELKCSLLLRAGALVNARDELGMTPLHFAASQFYNKRIVSLLIKSGADVNAFSNRLLTPLFLAVETGKREAIELLLSHGADPLLENDQFDSALKHAEKKQLLSVFQANGCDMSAWRNKITACGLWLIASLFNHSAMPNTYRSHVGSLMFVRAAQDLKEGTELSVAYMQDDGVLKKKWGIRPT